MKSAPIPPDFGFLLLRPQRLISLWDMIEFCVRGFVAALDRLRLADDYACVQTRDRGNDATANTGEQESLKRTLADLRHYCVWLYQTEAIGRIDKFSIKLSEPNHCSFLVIHSEIEGIRLSVIEELKGCKFAHIPMPSVQYFERDALFGPDVDEAFPSVDTELKQAGTCIALDLHTAAVFHLMRAVELALRILARGLGVNKIGSKDLEYCGLDPLIGAVDNAIQSELKVVNQGTGGNQRQKDSEYYGGLLSDVRFFGDDIRNPVSHSRKSYNPHSAEEAFDHVRGFLQRLATRVAED
jgi:hypothetical protein